MIKAICDKCGIEYDDAEKLERVYLYEDSLDLCDECMKVYEKAEKEMADMAMKERQLCERHIREESMKILKKYEKKMKK